MVDRDGTLGQWYILFYCVNGYHFPLLKSLRCRVKPTGSLAFYWTCAPEGNKTLQCPLLLTRVSDWTADQGL